MIRLVSIRRLGKMQSGLVLPWGGLDRSLSSDSVHRVLALREVSG